MDDKKTEETKARQIFFALLLVVSVTLAILALVLPLLSSSLAPAVSVGQVAFQEYRAPQTVTYVSEVLTEQRRTTAERSVAPVYTPLDTRIARQQLERLRATLQYITTVQADAYASTSQKMDDLAALDDIQLSPEAVETILGLSDSRWQATQQEALVVLEKVMSSPIRPENLDAARALVPAQVSLSLPEAQADVVAEIVAAFVITNSEYSEELTESARQKVRESVEPVNRTFIAGQTVVREGQILDAENVEALQKLGLVQPEQDWKDWVGAIVLVLLMLTFMLLYIRHDLINLLDETRSMAVFALLFLVFLVSARLVIPSHNILPYVFPLAAYSLTIAVLFGSELAMASSLPLALLVTYGQPEAVNLSVYYLMTCLFGVLSLGRARRISAFFGAGAVIAVSGAAVVMAYSVPDVDGVGLATLAGAALVYGLASASLAILLQFFLAQLLRMISPMQLSDLSRPDHPLLQRLLHDAPGTYQHSLQVANLAEQAAEQIGADPLLTRVGALYHDVGKSRSPGYFIENQPLGLPNPHDLLDPLESAKIIQSHVNVGLELGRKHRLPRRILDFIAEHHGTLLTSYQYVNAVKANGGDKSLVDESLFRYPGPRPGSRETAILMLADGCEARIRAERPKDEEHLHKMIRDMVDARVAAGQLDDTNLTLRDLAQIVESFATTLRGVYHPRVQYPQLDQKEAPQEQPAPPVAESSTMPSDLQVDAQPK